MLLPVFFDGESSGTNLEPFLGIGMVVDRRWIEVCRPCFVLYQPLIVGRGLVELDSLTGRRVLDLRRKIHSTNSGRVVLTIHVLAPLTMRPVCSTVAANGPVFARSSMQHTEDEFSTLTAQANWELG